LCAAAIFVTDHVRRLVPPPGPHSFCRRAAGRRAEDYSSAYRHTASEIAAKFTVPQFEAMIRRDYGDMMNAQRVNLNFLKIIGSAAVVRFLHQRKRFGAFISLQPGRRRRFVENQQRAANAECTAGTSLRWIAYLTL
jgi:hypothetical protein